MIQAKQKHSATGAFELCPLNIKLVAADSRVRIASVV